MSKLKELTFLRIISGCMDIKKKHSTIFLKILLETLEFPYRLHSNMVEKFCYQMKNSLTVHNTAPKLEFSILNLTSSDTRCCCEKRPEALFTQPTQLKLIYLLMCDFGLILIWKKKKKEEEAQMVFRSLESELRFLKSGCVPWVQPTEYSAFSWKFTIYRKFFTKTLKKNNNTDVVTCRSRAHLLFIYSVEKYCITFIIICVYFCLPFPQSKQLWKVRFSLWLKKSSVCLSDWLIHVHTHILIFLSLWGH